VREIVLLYVKKQGLKGDRSTEMSEYYDYEIHIANGDVAQGDVNTLVHTIEGYDHFHCAPHNQQEVYNEALGFAKTLARVSAIGGVRLQKDDFDVTRKRALAKLSAREREVLGL
jgi:hypothetical protein